MAQAVLQSSTNVMMAYMGVGHRLTIESGGGRGGITSVGISGGVPLLLPKLKTVHVQSRNLGVGTRTSVQHHSKSKCAGFRGAVGVRCSLNEAPSPSGPDVYQGVYGPWSVEAEDVREVVLYRSGLVTCAAAFVIGASSAFMPDDFFLKSFLHGFYDPLYILGAGGLGLSLVLIHIYVTPIKRALQFLWAVGVFGSVALALNFAAPADKGLVEFVLDNPAGIWAVGPLFAALTGLAFKEGLCYGKFEAAGLFLVIPSLLIGHLSGIMDDNTKLGFLAAWTALITLFASRKFTQPIKDDIGDKSVFIFQGLPEEEKQKLTMKLQEQYGKESNQN
ncbi:unnamed protein product [Calypogeia fissa]